MIDWIKDRLTERTSWDGVALIGAGLLLWIAPVTPISWAMIAYGGWTLLKSE
jgi:hypothetical protein